MVLTAAQTTNIFENAGNLAIQHDTRVKLQEEGLQTVDDLVNFDDETMKQVAHNLRYHNDRVPDPNPGAAAGATILRGPYQLGAISMRRIKEAGQYVQYLMDTGRERTAANMRYNPVIKHFALQWKALEQKRDDDKPSEPKPSRSVPILKWVPAFKDFLSCVVGVRCIPLSYVIRDDVAVPAAAPALLPNLPHSEEHGSVQGELVARASHDHALFRDDNQSVYHHIEAAMRGTQYAATVKRFQAAKNGRGAFLALSNQHAGADKWQEVIDNAKEAIQTTKWKGQNNFPLSKYVAIHRGEYQNMEDASAHVAFQLPNDRTRVRDMLNNIENGDPELQAAMAGVRHDDALMEDFEAAVARILPSDPVAKKRRGEKKRGSADISAVGGEIDADVGAIDAARKKPAIGKTGVELRWYDNKAEFAALSKAQKKELAQYRKEHNIGPPKGAHPKKPKKQVKFTKSQTQKMIDSAVAAATGQTAEDKEAAELESDLRQVISSMIAESKGKGAVGATTAAAPKAPLALKSILRRVSKGGKSG